MSFCDWKEKSLGDRSLEKAIEKVQWKNVRCEWYNKERESGK